MDEFKELAISICSRRLELDHSLDSLAALCELDKSYLSKIENNQLPYAPSTRAIAKIATALDLDEYRLNLLAGHIPLCVKPLVCQFLLIVGDRANQTMEDAISQCLNE